MPAFGREWFVEVGARADAFSRLPPGFGFLVPRDEGLRILGAVFSSRLFGGRTPDGHELLTVPIDEIVRQADRAAAELHRTVSSSGAL